MIFGQFLISFGNLYLDQQLKEFKPKNDRRNKPFLINIDSLKDSIYASVKSELNIGSRQHLIIFNLCWKPLINKEIPLFKVMVTKKGVFRFITVILVCCLFLLQSAMWLGVRLQKYLSLLHLENAKK